MNSLKTIDFVIFLLKKVIKRNEFNKFINYLNVENIICITDKTLRINDKFLVHLFIDFQVGFKKTLKIDIYDILQYTENNKLKSTNLVVKSYVK
jgi:hypothetical protein